MELYTENTVYTVKRRFKDSDGSSMVEMTTNHGQDVVLGEEYVDKMLNSASEFKKTSKTSRTELIQQIESNAKIAMTVCFTKLPILKDKKSLLKNSDPSKMSDLELGKLVKQIQQGDEREMIGYYAGSKNESGRLNFFDAESNILKQVDPRTVSWAIIKGIKYIVK